MNWPHLGVDPIGAGMASHSNLASQRSLTDDQRPAQDAKTVPIEADHTGTVAPCLYLDRTRLTETQWGCIAED